MLTQEYESQSGVAKTMILSGEEGDGDGAVMRRIMVSVAVGAYCSGEEGPGTWRDSYVQASLETNFMAFS